MNVHVGLGSAADSNRLLALSLAEISSWAPPPSPARSAPKRPRYELTWADAKALTEAGLMPVSHYIELAERHGWSAAGR